MAPLMTTLCNRPDLAKRVKQLCISSTWSDPTAPPNHVAMYSPQLELIHPPIDLSGYRMPDSEKQVPTFVENMTLLLLQKTENVEVLELRCGAHVVETMTPRTLNKAGLSLKKLNNLRELRLGSRCDYGTLAGLAYLLELAPRLSTLSIDREFRSTHTSIMSRYLKGVRNLELKGLSFYETLDIVGDCEKLTSFSFHSLSHFDHTSGIMHALNQHKESLKSLRWEFHLAGAPEERVLLQTLRSLTCLENLSLTTDSFVRKFSEWKHRRHELKEIPTPLLETLPESLRSLEIFQGTNAIDEQLLSLAKAHRRGPYPNLEEITLQIRQSCSGSRNLLSTSDFTGSSCRLSSVIFGC
ncbi:Fc.00g023250.m01.CDS01 [Cosmosporella sp. VM-42]